MRDQPHPARRIPRLLAVLLATSGILVAASTPSGAPAKSMAPAPGIPADPNVTDERTTRLNEEIADSLEKRFRSSPMTPGDAIDSENVFARPVKPVVVDEMKAWRTRFDSALKQYEQSTDAVAMKAAEDLFIGILMSPDAPVDIQRDCLKQLAQIALDGRFYGRAQQIYSQLVSRFPIHPDTPAVLLRQGVLYRRVGANELALSKFHAVMSTVLSLSEKDISGYKALVLLAQTEIADTYFMAGQFDRAADYFRRVLKLADADLNEAQVRLKLVKAVFEMKDWKNVIVEGQQCIEKIALSSQIAEVRFLMAEAYKQLGLQREALQQTMALLNAEQARSSKDPANWAYWQKRTGNALANELYQQGDYLNALLIYQTLWKLPGDEEWRSQALYQMGLIYERMEQADRAISAYSQILEAATNNVPANAVPAPARATDTAAKAEVVPSGKPTPDGAEPPKAPSPGLQLLREMAGWRLQNLRWDQGVSREVRNLTKRALADSAPPSAPSPLPTTTNATPGQGATPP